MAEKENASRVKTAEENASGVKTSLYCVKSPLLHNHESFAVGDDVELAESEAAPLLAVKVVELKPASKGGKNG